MTPLTMAALAILATCLVTIGIVMHVARARRRATVEARAALHARIGLSRSGEHRLPRESRPHDDGDQVLRASRRVAARGEV